MLVLLDFEDELLFNWCKIHMGSLVQYSSVTLLFFRCVWSTRIGSDYTHHLYVRQLLQQTENLLIIRRAQLEEMSTRQVVTFCNIVGCPCINVRPTWNENSLYDSFMTPSCSNPMFYNLSFSGSSLIVVLFGFVSEENMKLPQSDSKFHAFMWGLMLWINLTITNLEPHENVFSDFPWRIICHSSFEVRFTVYIPFDAFQMDSQSP